MTKPTRQSYAPIARAWLAWSAAAVTLVLAGCASTAGPELGRRYTGEAILYPTPPDTPRVQYFTTFSSELDMTGESEASLLESIIGEDEEDRDEEIKEFNKPYGVTIHDGVIYVCDSMLPGVEVLDLRGRTFEYFKPVSLGTLEKPINCTTDDEGSLYVADTGRRQVVVFDSVGQYVDSFGEVEGGKPTDVFVEGRSIWVADVEQGLVHVYDRATRRLVQSLPGPGVPADEALFQPTNLWVEGDRVYVSDFGDFRIKIYSREGDFLTSVGSFGRALGQFVRPKGVAVDRDGLLYVVDAGFDNVQVFDPEGRLLMFFGGTYSGPGDMWLPAKVHIDYQNIEYFQPFVEEGYDLKYLILVTNQYGPDRLNVYGFVEPRLTDDPRPVTH